MSLSTITGWNDSVTTPCPSRPLDEPTATPPGEQCALWFDLCLKRASAHAKRPETASEVGSARFAGDSTVTDAEQLAVNAAEQVVAQRIQDLARLEDGWGGEDEIAPDLVTLSYVRAIASQINRWFVTDGYRPVSPRLSPGFLGQVQLKYFDAKATLYIEVVRDTNLHIKVTLVLKNESGYPGEPISHYTALPNELREYITAYLHAAQ